MKRFTLIVVLLVCAVAMQAQPIKRWKIDDLLQYADTNDSVLVINFWATFCVPCIAELPYFHSITNKYKKQNVKLLLVSLDFEEYYPKRIRDFANKRKYTAEIVWLDEEKPDEFCPRIDPKWTGSMPATLFVNKKTGYRKFIEAEMKPEDLEREVKLLVGQINP
ncbi:TlpA disulfide reductase family protein [Lacibacter sp.]|uniref:TlpA disulfide reductase family protein n=1 Tax=Lacibacter sp. TaxID=1915409 RepID=UPI002B4B0A8B|nr:TlpA disulfide reductase family protein [Lacibacter sp.]HLP38915.1 TlpA disulfide reductase family protein [Lacibacter sp.]